MSSSTPFSSSSPGFAVRGTGSAWLLLDLQGVVRAAGSAAATLWLTTPETLAGRPFAGLFAFEVVSREPGFLEAQWEAIVASATESTVTLDLQPAEGEPRQSRVRLERLPGDGGYVASVSITAPRSASTPPLPARAAAGLDLLADSRALGFFDLQFATGEVVYSATWYRLLGYNEGELEPTYGTWRRLLHPDDSAAAPDHAGRPGTAGEHRTFNAEFRMKHRRGHWLWLQGSGVQAFDANGTLARTAGVLLDISERKEVEEQGLLADDQLSRLTREGELAVFDLDFARGHAAVTPAWERLVGGGPTPTLAGLAPLFGAADAAALAARLRGSDPGAHWQTRPETLRTPKGEPIPVTLGLHRHFSRRGDLLRVVGFALPAPAQDDAAPTAERLEAALAAVNEAVIIADNRARIAFVNTKAAQLTGCPLQLARTLKLADVFRLVTLADGRPAGDAVDLALASEQQPRMNTAHALAPADGSPPRGIVWSASETRGADGQISGIVVVFRDPAEMSLSPEELIRANRFESLGQLAGGIAHDFNNLLTTILGGISQARENHDRSHLEDAETACLAAKTLTRQLLAFAKGSAGGALQVVRPAEIMRDAVRIASAGATARINFELDEAAGPIEADRGQLLQVFQNLIINALQAMPDPSRGVIQLRCRSIALAADQIPPLPAGRYVQMEVQDNGSGIAPEHLDQIFEPFFTTKKQGTGLGLATVLAIVRKHGGQLGVESVVGSGTTFTAFLPVTERKVEENVRRAPTLRFGTGRILLMDDDPKITALTTGMLHSLDYTYDTAKNGEEAVALYRRYLNIGRPYDAVILDLTVIGGMGGEECFKQLQELDPDVRAIVSSGYDNDEMTKRFLDLGFVGYLTKPYRVGDLGKILKSVLGR